MSVKLPLKKIVQSSHLHMEEHFPECVFELLGKNLTAWLTRRLAEVGCTENPIVKGDVAPGAVLEGPVYVSKTAKVGPGAYVIGPAYIGPGADVRHGAFIRGSVYVGKDAVVGHTTEAKGACFFDGAKAGHFAYVGDSLLAPNVNLGAGTKLANLKLANNEVKFKDPLNGLKPTPSGLRKFGAILAEGAQTGCNSVLSPGSILMPGTGVYPCVHYHGTLEKGFAKS